MNYLFFCDTFTKKKKNLLEGENTASSSNNCSYETYAKLAHFTS